MRRYLRLVAAFSKNNWHIETAFFGNNIFAFITPLMYVLSFLLFMTVLFQNINTLAGYSKDETLFIIFIGQLSFYTYNFWAAPAVEYLNYYVNQGTFDYFLVRPVSSLFNITFHRIFPLRLVTNFIGPLTPTWLIINWANLDINYALIPIGLLLLFFGILLYHYVQFILTCIVFWTGQAQQSQLIVYAASSQTLPLEAFSTRLKFVFLLIIPVYVSSVTGSVMLGKSNALFWTLAMLTVTIIFAILKRVVWAKALRQYSSASS